MIFSRPSNDCQANVENPTCPVTCSEDVYCIHLAIVGAQGYVRRRLLGLANMPCVAKSLNCPSEVICQALIQALEMGHLEREDSDPSQPGAAEWQLVFRHDCL